jgi:uncharacterized protein YyaL (SSP411 family)
MHNFREDAMPNRLASETSPYLLQHAGNPVDWYPWGDEAIGRARGEGKPIFLSIGYSACHWCHVMEHESFENPRIAKLLNDHFISIKVDREERPDLDHIYMQAVQLISGRGGWPMSVFLTTDLQPFFGGTYWPPEARMGMPGFDQVLMAVVDAWNHRQDQVLTQASTLTEHISSLTNDKGQGEPLNEDLLWNSAAKLEQAFDSSYGGFGDAPKFPHSMDLQLLLRIWRRKPRDGVLHMVQLTLDKMAAGGIRDHLAGGFARYSVDARWLVPHFEKMLYDNALLANAYLDAFQATGNGEYRDVVRSTLDYVRHYMTDPEGGFYSAEDADSEGQEGKFYVWSRDEVVEVLGSDAAERFCYVYDVTERGNFEGQNILNLPKTIEQCAALRHWDVEQLKQDLAQARDQLLSVRDRRVRPGKDDKILVSWNGLMIDAMARAGGVLDEPAYLQAAERAASFIRNVLRKDDGRLLHTWRNGTPKIPAYLDDYACLANGLLSLYGATFDEQWMGWAVELLELTLKHFASDTGSLYQTAGDQEQLIARSKDLYDSSVPSGNSMAATALIRAGRLCARDDFLMAAEGILKAHSSIMKESPTASGQMLVALDLWLGPSYEVIVMGGHDDDQNRDLKARLQQLFAPNCLLAYRDGRRATIESPLEQLFQDRAAIHGHPTAYICQQQTCREPVSGVDAILEAMRQIAPP